MPKKIKKKISQATLLPIDIGFDEKETSNEDFDDQQTPRIKDVSKEIPSKDIEHATQKSWPDIVYPFTKKLNLYTVFFLIIYLAAIISGHLSNWTEFLFATFAIAICSLITFLINYIYSKTNRNHR